jgi:DNA-binding MarR family transcriptional regulator
MTSDFLPDRDAEAGDLRTVLPGEPTHKKAVLGVLNLKSGRYKRSYTLQALAQKANLSAEETSRTLDRLVQEGTVWTRAHAESGVILYFTPSARERAKKEVPHE